MILTSVYEYAFIKANLLLNQTISKKGNKNQLNEIIKMCETFGKDFEKNIYKSILEDFDYKDVKLTSSTTKSTKVQFFLKEFPIQLEKDGFYVFFSEVINLAKFPKVSSLEFFDYLTKLCKLNIENQLKLIISMNFSKNEICKDSSKVFIGKVKEIEKEVNLSSEYLQILLCLCKTYCPENMKIYEIFNTSLNKILFSNYNQHMCISNSDFTKDNSKSASTSASEYDYLLGEVFECIDSYDNSIDTERIIMDIGPYIINNNISLEKNILLDSDMNEQRLADFIVYLLRHQTFNEDRDIRQMNKTFLKNISLDLASSIDDNNEKKVVTTWNLDNIYKYYKSKIDCLDYNIVIEFLDQKDFIVKDKKTLEFLIQILSKFKFSNVYERLFNFLFKSEWKYTQNQIDFISFVVYNNIHDLFPYKNFCRKCKKLQNYNPYPNGITQSNNQFSQGLISHIIETMSCVDVIKGIVSIGHGNFYLKVKELLEWSIENIPIILILVFSEIEFTNDNFLVLDIIQIAFPLSINHNTISLFEELERKDINFLTKTLAYLYKSKISYSDVNNKDSNSLLMSILEVCHKSKVVNKIINSTNDYVFTLPLALLSVKKDHLNFEQWLSEQVISYGEKFIKYLLSYIKENILDKYSNISNITNITNNQQSQVSNTTSILNITNKSNPDTQEKKIIHENENNIDTGILSKENLLENAHFNLESLSMVFSCLSSDKSKKISKQLQGEISNLYKQIYEIFDELYVHSVNSEEVETKTNSLFDSYFKEEITISELITILKKYKNSTEVVETETYALMVYSVLDEYRFLSKYPDQQLKSIAVLFGQLILNKMFDGIIENIALKYVVQALTGLGNMYLFGIIAFEQIIEKISLFPSFSDTVYKMNLKNHPVFDKFNEKYQEVYIKTSNALNINSSSYKQVVSSNSNQKEYNDSTSSSQTHLFSQKKQGLEDEKIEKVVSKVYDESNKDEKSKAIAYNQGNQASFTNQISQSSQVNQSSTSQNRSKLQKTMEISQIPKGKEVLDTNTSKVPIDIVDKTRGIFFSLSKNNISEKANELKQLILTDDKHLEWFSSYFIIQRATQSNNHSAYSEFISNIDSKELNNLLIKETILNIKKLLNTDKLEEKNILKSLGSWLGIMTLSKNKPIQFKDLDLKELLLKSYEGSGKLPVILNLVCKILEYSYKTKVFHSKNPWLMTLLYIIAEIYSKQQGYNLIFHDIESLFKKLELDINQFINKTNYLEAYTKEEVKKELDSLLEVKLSDILPQIEVMEGFLEDSSKALSNILIKQVKVNDLLSMISYSLQLAINEIINSVADRAITISFSTTKEMIKKDFAYEKNEKVYKSAIVNSIKSFTRSLAMVTCKEPLRTTFINYLKEQMIKNSIEIIDSVSDVIVQISSNQEILDIGCYYIQNFVINKALDMMEKDKSILEEIDCRKNNLNILGNAQFQLKINTLPDSIKYKINPSLCRSTYKPPENMVIYDINKVYEDFERVYDRQSRKDSALEKMSLIRMIVPALKEYTDQSNNSGNSKFLQSKLEICLMNIRTLAINQGSIDYIEMDENICILSKLISESEILKSKQDFNVNENIKQLVMIILKYIIISAKHSELTLLNLYTEILKGYTLSSQDIRKEITSFILNNTEETQIRFNVDIHFYFFRKNIFDLEEWETYFEMFLSDNVQNKFAKRLLFELVEKKTFTFGSTAYDENYGTEQIEEISILGNCSFSLFKRLSPIILDYQNNATYFDLFFKKKSGNSLGNVKTLLDYKQLKVKEELFIKIKEYVKFNFQEFVVCYYDKPADLKKVVLKIFENNNDENIVPSVMILTEMSLDYHFFIDNDCSFNIIPSFVAIFIYKCLELSSFSMKIKLLEMSLYSVFRVLCLDYSKNNINFNQKPYLKIFFSLIKLISESSAEEIFENYKKYQYFLLLSDFFKLLKPSIFPGFSLAWLEIISCSYFTSIMLGNMEGDKKIHIIKQEKYCELLSESLVFISSKGNNKIIDYNYKYFYDQVIKLFYLLGNTYPDFFNSFYIPLITSLPISQGEAEVDGYVQIKNIILSSNHSSTTVDFFKEDLKIENIPDTKKTPIVSFDVTMKLKEIGLKEIVDEILLNKSDSKFNILINKLSEKENSIGFYYLTCYVGVSIKSWFELKQLTYIELLEFFNKLLKSLNEDAKNCLIQAMLNEVKYLCSTTYFYVILILSIIVDNKNGNDEHILRNILLRLMVKPYTSGLVWLVKDFSKHQKFESINKKLVKNNPKFENIIPEIFRFVQESYKNLENYL